jgi:predicted alpha/beta hydrolase family esterase
LLLVAPPASEQVPDAGADLRLQAFDARAVRSSVRGEIRIACSDADPYNPAGAQSLYATPLGVAADVLEGAQHINPASGFGPWPFAEAWCLGEAGTGSAVAAVLHPPR